MRKTLLVITAMVAVCFLFGSVQAQKKPKKLPRVCGNPDEACKGRSYFQSYDLPVEWPENSVIAESEPFYAIILKSAKFDYSSGADCEKVYSDSEIFSTQTMFPTNKVFALKCFEPGGNYYIGVDDNYVFIAVFAGKTLAAANKFLKTVQDTGQFPGVKVRKMRVGVNGT
ncbi:MAG TPA: hypothetical protein PKC65_15805 [Pyrinomonadaceae bacterium]|nr:hypothetical protein [Pyrinomonadaceae bacterium]